MKPEKLWDKFLWVDILSGYQYFREMHLLTVTNNSEIDPVRKNYWLTGYWSYFGIAG